MHYDGLFVSNCYNPQYKTIKYEGIVLKAGTLADSCCGLNCGAIVCIENIAHSEHNIPVIIGREFLEKKDLYNVPCPSSLLGIYIIHSYSNLKSWPLKSVVRKYMKLPLENDKYAVFPLIHSKM